VSKQVKVEGCVEVATSGLQEPAKSYRPSPSSDNRQRVATRREGLRELIALAESRGLACELAYSVEGEHEFATLTVGHPGTAVQTVRYGWRSGEPENESLAHVWLWLALKQAISG